MAARQKKSSLSVIVFRLSTRTSKQELVILYFSDYCVIWHIFCDFCVCDICVLTLIRWSVELISGAVCDLSVTLH